MVPWSSSTRFPPSRAPHAGEKQAQLGKPTPKVRVPLLLRPLLCAHTAVHRELTSGSRSPRRPETESQPREPSARSAAAARSCRPHAPSSTLDPLLFHTLGVLETRRRRGGTTSSSFPRPLRGWWSVVSLSSPPPFPTERGHRVGSGTERASPSPPAAPPAAVPAVRTAAPAPLWVRDYQAEPGDRIANELPGRSWLRPSAAATNEPRRGGAEGGAERGRRR